MVNFWKIAICLLIILSLVKISLFNVNSNNYYWDEAVYMDLAKNIREQGSYYSSMSEDFRPPLFPALLAMFPDYALAHLFIAMVSLASIFLAYLLAKEIFNRNAGIVAALFLAINPLYYFWSSKLLTEPIALSLILLSLYLFVRFEKRNDSNCILYLSFFIAGLALLARYTSLSLIGALVADAALKKKIFKKQYMIAFVFLVLALLPLFILGIKNYGSPIGMLVQNSAATTNPKIPIMNYAQNFFNDFGYVVPLLFLVGLFGASRKKIPKVMWYYLLLTIALLISISQKYDRYLLALLPVFIAIAAAGLTSTIKEAGRFGQALLIIILAFSLVASYYNVKLTIAESHNMEILLDAARFVKDSVCGGIISNSPKHFQLFANKKTIGYPATKQEFLVLQNEENISCFGIDSFHGLPDYRKFINDTYKLIYANSSDNKFAYVYKK